MTPDVFLDSAKALGRGNTEIDWRNAVSRAYYAAFHRCRSIAESLDPNLDTTTKGGHAAVIDLLQQSPAPRTQVSLGYMLDACRKQRNIADYEIELDFSQVSCHTTIEMCVEILKKAGTLN